MDEDDDRLDDHYMMMVSSSSSAPGLWCECKQELLHQVALPTKLGRPLGRSQNNLFTKELQFFLPDPTPIITLPCQSLREDLGGKR